jgi:hypothetical protein
MTTSDEAEASGDDIRRAAAAALSDVDALGVDGEDRSLILKAVLDARLRASTDTPRVSTWSGGEPAAAPLPPVASAPADGDDVLGRIGAALKVDRDTLELIYAVDDDEPQVVVSAKKIAPNKALATRQLGQLIAAARQAAGLEEWTSVGTIRAVVQEYGRLDSNNFASSIQQMDDACLVKGKGLQRVVKVTKPGYDLTGDLVKSIAGTES